MDAVGASARERRRDALARIATFIKAESERLGKGDSAFQRRPFSVFLGAVYAIRQLASDALDRHETALLRLAPDLNVWLTDTLRASTASRDVAPRTQRQRAASR
jgi:hypothetical protein